MSQGLTSQPAKKTLCQIRNTVTDSFIVNGLRYNFRHKNTVIHRKKKKYSLRCLKEAGLKAGK